MKKIQIRVDNQSGMVDLVNDKVLKKLNIEIVPGDSKNVNKNPVEHIYGSIDYKGNNFEMLHGMYIDYKYSTVTGLGFGY